MQMQPVGGADRWYVTNGVLAVGPIGFELLTRGVAHGEFPTSSLVRHESWRVWRPLEDIGALSSADRQEAIERFAGLSANTEARASRPDKTPSVPPASQDKPAAPRPLDEEVPSRPSVRPAAVDPVGVLSNASSLDDAFLLALSTSVTAAAATVGLVHRVRPDLGATVTEYGHGPGAEMLLGEILPAEDPCLLAAQAGHTVIAEPRPGEAGRSAALRIGRCIANPRGVAAVPLHLHGGLVAMLEVGRTNSPFRACEIARIEDTLEVLTERLVVAGWLD